ncbi:MAG: hypothetical protein SVM80_00630 [Halobacteriota archaeon]|nr:hypothetical protein [Halobacteriota archaeon]
MEDGDDELSASLDAMTFICSVFEERIIPALKLFGLLYFEYGKNRDEYFIRHCWGIEWFSVTGFGKKIFKAVGI